MVEITSELVKKLREKTGSGMMDCKKALVEANGNFDKAVELLEAKGLIVVDKKATRVAAEGLVSVAIEGKEAVLLEVNAETDFVAKNNTFKEFVKEISKLALKVNTLEDLKATKYKDSTVQEELNALIMSIGENMIIRKFEKFSAEKGFLVPYVHGEVEEGLGKIIVVLNLEGDESKKEIAKRIGMHIVAYNPKALSIESLDPKILEEKRAEERKVVENSGKPADIIEKMVEGRISKFFQEVCLLEQGYIMDEKKKVKEVLKENSLDLLSYKKVVLGEGVEKVQEDFAKEVSKIIG